MVNKPQTFIWKFPNCIVSIKRHNQKKILQKKNLSQKNHYTDKKKATDLYNLVRKITTFRYKKIISLVSLTSIEQD